MCLITLAYRAHPDWPLLLAANRDEFHARPAAPLAWWDDRPQVLAGRDLQEGGAWLGVSRGGRVAAVTNVRGPDAAERKPRSRGALVADFLDSTDSAAAFADALEARAMDYGGFNLLVFDGQELRYVSNRPRFVSEDVAPGVHALSNAQLDTPWPKARAAHAAMDALIARGEALQAGTLEPALLAALADPAQAADEALPLTGVSLDMERLLSSAFIQTRAYGTRCTTVLCRAADGRLQLLERRFDPDGRVAGETRETFVQAPPP